MTTIARTVEKDDIYRLAKAVEIMRYIVQEIEEDFFDAYNPSNKDDHWRIAHEFRRNRAKTEILADNLREIEEELKKHDITYWDN